MSGIIVGVDGSDHSRRALRFAMDEAGRNHAPVTVMTVMTVMTVRPAPVSPAASALCAAPIHLDGDHDLDVARTRAWELVDKVASDIGETVPVIVRAVRGDPARELLKESSDADMVVVGTRGAGGFARLMMGSVSTKVAQHATCPVVVIP